MVKVEDRRRPDRIRTLGPQVPLTAGHTAGPAFLHVNAGKRGLILDLADAGGTAELRRLIDAADVVVESLEPADRARLGFGADEFRLRHPGVVLVTVTPYGPDGPAAGRPADDLTLMAESGWLAVQGEPGRPPLATGGDNVSYLTGQYAALGAVAALHLARSGGAAQIVDVRALEAAVASEIFDTVAYAYTGCRRARRASHVEDPWFALPAADGHIVIGKSAFRAWDDLWAIVFGPDAVADAPPTDATGWARRLELLRTLTRGRSKHDLAELAQLLGFGVGEVLTLPEVLELPQLVERDHFDVVDYVSGGLRHAGAPARLPRAPWAAGRRAPAPDEHRAQVLAEWLDAPRRHPDPAGGAERRPLDGVRVVDFTMGWAGPFATQLLADLGADVVKIESVTRTDWWRTARRMFTGEVPDPDYLWEKSPMFNSVNSGKSGITLDLSRPEGRDLVRELIRSADLVVENFTPRVMRAFGLTYDELIEINPGLVMVSMPGFGLDGPLTAWRSTAMVTESAAGLTDRCAYTDGVPQVLAMCIADPNAGMVAALAATLALHERARTGVGQHVEVAQVEALTGHVGAELLELQVTGAPPARRDNTSPGSVLSGVYPACGADEWVAVSVPDDGQLRALAGVIGADQDAVIGADRDTVRAAGPVPAAADAAGDRAAIEISLAQWIRRRPASEAAQRLQAAAVPAAAVRDAAQVLADERLTETGFFQRISRAYVGEQPYPAAPLRMSPTPLTTRRPAPTLGQDNERILRERLGRSADEIRELERDGLIGRQPVGTANGWVVPA